MGGVGGEGEGGRSFFFKFFKFFNLRRAEDVGAETPRRHPQQRGDKRHAPQRNTSDLEPLTDCLGGDSDRPGYCRAVVVRLKVFRCIKLNERFHLSLSD
jgi:hypothetical protein